MAFPSPLAATIAAHLDQARSNYRLYAQFRDAGKDLDWAVVFLFYAAVHLVQAHAVQYEPTPPVDHSQRNAYVAMYLANIETEYGFLYQASRSARYNFWDPSAEELAHQHDEWFVPLREELESLGFVL